MAALAALARRLCLQNAVQHGGTCQPKSLMGRVMGAHPEHRADAAGVMAALVAAAAEVNAMGLEAQREALAAEAPEMLDAPKRERQSGLKPLPDAAGKVVLRFAPNPNGPLSLGHARGLSILDAYAREHDAELILRFDDTDPQVKPPLLDAARGWDGYAMVREDVEWLIGRAATREVVASDRIGSYHDAARRLIEAGGAYVCACDAEAFRALKNAAKACPHRELGIDEQEDAFTRMLDGSFAAGEAVLRVKTDIQHADPALRDWTAMRIVRAVHPRAARGEIMDHRVWPLLDFESAVEDHEQGVTHVIRGKDLMDSTRKQAFLYQHMGWTYPKTLYWGRVRLHGFGRFSTSWMREEIEKGTFTGWDDVRLPTLRALRRRGYRPEAIRDFWVGLGLTEKDIAVSQENLDAENAKRTDAEAPRFFFVPEPKAMSLTGAEGREARPAVHPNHPERGTRLLPAATTINLPEEDSRHPQVRLKDLGNVVLAGGAAFFAGSEMDRSLPIVQWLPRGHAEPFVVLRPGIAGQGADAGPDAQAGPDEAGPDAQAGPDTQRLIPPLEAVEGVVEPAALDHVGQVVQFERFGFVRIENRGQGVWLHA